MENNKINSQMQGTINTFLNPDSIVKPSIKNIDEEQVSLPSSFIPSFHEISITPYEISLVPFKYQRILVNINGISPVTFNSMIEIITSNQSKENIQYSASSLRVLISELKSLLDKNDLGFQFIQFKNVRILQQRSQNTYQLIRTKPLQLNSDLLPIQPAANIDPMIKMNKINFNKKLQKKSFENMLESIPYPDAEYHPNQTFDSNVPLNDFGDWISSFSQIDYKMKYNLLSIRQKALISFYKQIDEHKLYEDKSFIIVQKDAGIISYCFDSTDKNPVNTYGVLEIMKYSTRNENLSLINVLDTQSSGIIILAKDPAVGISMKDAHNSMEKFGIVMKCFILIEGTYPLERDIIHTYLNIQDSADIKILDMTSGVAIRNAKYIKESKIEINYIKKIFCLVERMYLF